MKRVHNVTIIVVIMWVFQILVPRTYVNAATIRQISFAEMVQESQLVFDGKVIALKAKEDGPRNIHTYVTFEIEELIKGKYDQNTIILRFLGGTVNDITLVISDMKIPQSGEHGIYFVESLDTLQSNPLYGWNQGHFLVEPDEAGTQRVISNEKLPVTGLTGHMATYQMNSGRGEMEAVNQGVAKGVIVTKEKNSNQGMTIDNFKNILRQRLSDTIKSGQ